MSQRIHNVDGIGAGCRWVDQYNEDMLAHILGVGDSLALVIDPTYPTFYRQLIRRRGELRCI